MGIRIRPAFGLTILLLAAFALQVISVISVPVSSCIPLASSKDILYGVLGYCNTTTDVCKYVGIGYDRTFINAAADQFSISASVRYSLSKILIAHIVGAGLILILLVFTVFAHFHSVANSSKYLLVMIILTIPTFLVSLLSFIIDILLFLPHLSWGSWVVLGATVLILIYFFLLLIMNRALSNKKARKQATKDNSELQNLNENNFFGTDMVYGGENGSGYNSVSRDIGKYEPAVVAQPIGTNENDSSISLNEKHDDNTFSAVQYDTASAPLTYNRHLRTPSPSNQFINVNPVNRTNTVSPYKHVDLHTSVPNPSYQNQNQQLLEKNSVEDNINNNKNNTANDSPIVAGTYGDAENNSILQDDSYREFGVEVVPLPKIQNPEIMRAISNSPSKKYDNDDEEFTKNQRAGGYTYLLDNNRNDSKDVLNNTGANAVQNNINSSYVGGAVNTEMSRPPMDQTYFASSTTSPGRNNYNRLKEMPAAETQPHPYSSYMSQNSEYQPPAPKWRQQQQQQQSITSVSAPVYPPSTVFQRQPLREDYQNVGNNEDNTYSNTQPQAAAPPLSQQEQQSFYQPRRQQSPQQTGVDSSYNLPRRQAPQAPQVSDIMLNNNPDFELPSKKKQMAKGRQAPSSLRPGFGNLDSPYGASRGI